MHFDRLLDAQQARPFRPYTVVMTDGQRFVVRHPEFVYLHPDGRTIVLVEDETKRTHFLDRAHASDLVYEALSDPRMAPETAAG